MPTNGISISCDYKHGTSATCSCNGKTDTFPIAGGGEGIPTDAELQEIMSDQSGTVNS